MDKDELIQLLQGSTVPNTEQVKAATAELQKKYYSKPESLLLLIEITLTHDDRGLRQLASVQATRLVAKHWEKLPADKRELARSHLLEGVLQESTATVRHSLARLVAIIASDDMANQQGDDFLKQIISFNTSENVTAREAGSFILFSMLEDDPTHFSDHTNQLLQLFRSRIEDPQSKEVRINVVRAIGAMLMIIMPEEDPEAVKAVQDFIPSMVNTLKATIDADDNENYEVVFEVFDSFIAYSPAFLANHLRDLLAFMLELAANTEAADDARSQALTFIIQAVQYRRMKIQAMKDVAPQLMVKAMQIATELEDDEEEEEDASPAQVALGLIDTLASELPPKQAVVPLLELFPKFAADKNPRLRKAAILALGNAAEGAPEFISTQLKTVLPVVVNLLCDSDITVRHAALVGVMHLAEEMADEMASHHEEIISAVLKNLESASQGPVDKKNTSIIRCACGALDTLGDGIDNKVLARSGPNIVGPLVKLLDHEDFTVKAAAASAIGAVASSMELAFEPYFKDVMAALGKFVMIKDTEEAMELRSATCETLGRIASSVGAEAFQPYVPDLMRSSEDALGLNNARLKETSFILWSRLSKVYKENFDHFLGGIFQSLFASLELDEEELDIPGIDPEQLGDGSLVIGGKRIKVKVPDSQDDLTIAKGGDDEWDDIDDLEDLDTFDAVTAVANEQEIALDVLGDVIANSCNSSNLEQYVEKAIATVTPFAQHSYEGCRTASLSTLWRTYARVFKVWQDGAGVTWEAGLPLKQTPPASIITLGQALEEATVKIWSDDAERIVVTEINRNVAATLRECGPAVLGPKGDLLKEAISVVSLFLTRSHPCQQDLGDEEEEQEVDAGSSEYDWLAINTALDVIIGLAAALGPTFGEVWKVFQKPILKLASSTEDTHRSAAVATIADVIKYAGEAMTPFTETLGKTLVHRLGDSDLSTKAKAAYAIGNLVYYPSNADMTLPMYPLLWEKLEPLLDIQEEDMSDIVAGCLSRMMMKNPDGGFVSEVLPRVISCLPLKQDFEEHAPVFECIYKLYDQSNPTVQQLAPQLGRIFAQVLSPPEEQLDPETRLLVQRMSQHMES